MKNNICLIYNYAQHYRLAIFKLLNDELGVDFYFGDKMGDVKKLDYEQLSHFKGELRNRKFLGPFYWQSGALSTLSKPYKHYIILGEYFCLSTWLIAILAPLFGKKIYFWTHGWYGKEYGFMRIFKKFFFSLADEIFLYGDRAKSLMIQEGFQENKLHVIYNSLNYREQVIIRKELQVSSVYQDIFCNRAPVLIFIGRLTAVKRLDWAIEAVSLLKDGGIDVNLCIIGDGVEKKSLNELITKRQIEERVKLIDGIYDENLIAKYIYNADICVSPGNVGLTAMHSLVFGTPVITNDDFNTQMPEFESIIDGETGTFFKNNDQNDFVLKIKSWIQKNGARRQVIRESCYKQIDTFFNPDYQFKIINHVIKAKS